MKESKRLQDGLKKGGMGEIGEKKEEICCNYSLIKRF